MHPAPFSCDSSTPCDLLAASFATTYTGVVAFIAVVHEGSFARAADRLGIGRSAVSRSIRKLETQLDTRLFTRTTRSTALTDEGMLFYASCQPGVQGIVQAVEEMRDLRSGAPRGLLRIAVATGFGRSVVAPLLREFRAAYPEIATELIVDDRTVDFTAEGIDVAFRDGRLEDSQVVARQVIPMQMLVCAAPAYVAQYGLPETIDDLALHACVNLRLPSGRMREWEFRVDGAPRKWQPAARNTFNDAELVLQAVLDGDGIAQLAGYQVCAHLRSGRLVACLPQYAPDDRGHYLCYLNRRHLPARIRVFVDDMTARIRALDLHCITTFAAG